MGFHQVSMRFRMAASVASHASAPSRRSTLVDRRRLILLSNEPSRQRSTPLTLLDKTTLLAVAETSH